MTRKRTASDSNIDNTDQPTPFEKAVAIMRRYGDARIITTTELRIITHYVTLHAQQKGISVGEAMAEIAAEFNNSPSASSPAAPEVPIHHYTIAITTGSIPSIKDKARFGVAKVDEQVYVNSIRDLIRQMLEDNGLSQLVDRISVDPIEVRTELPQTTDYSHREGTRLARSAGPSSITVSTNHQRSVAKHLVVLESAQESTHQ